MNGPLPKIPEYTAEQLLAFAWLELTTHYNRIDGDALKAEGLHINGHPLVDIIMFHRDRASAFTLLTTALPEEEGDYLCQLRDGSVEMITLSELEIEYLFGSRKLLPSYPAMDQLYSWIPMEKLPLLPALPSMSRPVVTESHVIQ